MTQRTKAAHWLLAALLILMVMPGAVRAQDTSRVVLDRSATAVVRIRAVRGVEFPASGAIIDRRGYVLTSFHAVGTIDAAKNVPGTLLSSSNRYEVELYDPRSPDPIVWVARVVRGDIRADLGLLRLMAPLGPDRDSRFPSVALGATQNIGRNSVLFALGYKSAGSKPSVTRIAVRDVQRSQLSRLSWIFFAPALDAQSTGGVLLDSMSNVVGIATGSAERTKGGSIERARPIERVPNDWLDDLRRGHIHDVKIDGYKILADGGELHELAEGDSPLSQQVHFFGVPRRRPVAISVTPPLPLVLLGPNGNTLNRATGALTIRENDPANAIVAVDVSKSLKHALAYSIKTGAPGSLPTASASAGNTAAVVAGKGVLSGRLVHAVTGEPLKDAVVSVGKPGTNMENLIGRFLRGEVGKKELQSTLLGQARTDRNGRFSVRGLPQGKDLPVAGYKMTFRPVYLRAQIGPNQPKLDLGNIKVTYWEPIAY